jgi:myosin heavy subunit
MCKDGCNHKPKQAERGSISLKFNSGLPALLYRGEGLALISELGLHTEHELEHERTMRRLSSEQNAARVKELEDMLRGSQKNLEDTLESEALNIERALRAESERDALKARVALLEAELSEALKLGAAVSRAESAEVRVASLEPAMFRALQERDAARAQVEAMRASLVESRPWIRAAATRMYDGTRGNDARAAASSVLAKIDAALSALVKGAAK